MAQEEHQTYCPNCKRTVLGRREKPNHVLHFLVTFFTCGLWVLPWIIIAWDLGSKPYRCSICGTEGKNR